MKLAIMLTLLAGCCVLGFVIWAGTRKHVWIWVGGYLWRRMKGRPRLEAGEPIQIVFCMVDHFEPIQKGSGALEEKERLKAWIEGYPKFADKHTDSNGRPVQHTWFYPGEAYKSEYLEGLAGLCRRGYGEIELHHHHFNETSEGLRKSIKDCLEKFSKHGALIVDIDGKPQHAYGFIHGNMALDNSRFNDDLCGVNNELGILRETGCYADFGCPTAPCVSQTRKINSIYYAKDDPGKPKSHTTGVDVEVGKRAGGDLMIIQGPLGFNWKRRKFWSFPRIDNSEVTKAGPGTADRIDFWVKQHVHVKGKPNWVFVKVSCHGAENRNFEVLLGKHADMMYTYLEERYRDREGFRLHYVTAREMYNIIRAAEAGKDGGPETYREFRIPRYRNSD
jgi:hypothetical protein